MGEILVKSKYKGNLDNGDKKLSIKKSFKPKGHDAALQKLVEEQCDVELIVNDDAYIGKVIAYDKYAICFLSNSHRLKEPAWFYKHALTAFKKYEEVKESE